MSGLRRIQLTVSLLAGFFLLINTAYSATPYETWLQVQKLGLFNNGTGATGGKTYIPASPAIDLRNIMGTSFNLSNGNLYPEKYLFTPPYPAGPKEYAYVKARAEQHGLVAFFGNAFDKEDGIAIEILNGNLNTSQPNMINLADNKLINFSINNNSLSAQPRKGKSTAPAVFDHHSSISHATLKKVLDDSINLNGVKEAHYAVKMGNKSILLADGEKVFFKPHRHPQTHSARKMKVSFQKPPLNKRKKTEKPLAFYPTGKLGHPKLISTQAFAASADIYGLPTSPPRVTNPSFKEVLETC